MPDYYGHPDVFVIPAAGGEPRRLTYHPSLDTAAGWSPDGKSILFVSGRSSSADPALVRQGHDPQLEKAVDVILEQLKKIPLPDYKKPEHPNYHQ